jgi:release factor glutamine methyltransferase
MPAPELRPTSSAFSDSIYSDTVARLRAAGCVFAEDEAQLLLAGAANPAELLEFIERRTSGYPLEHILGWSEFCGLRIALEPGVFVPRRRTELLVNEAAALLRSNRPGDGGAPPPVVVDLCCGSGAVGAALADRVDGIELHAADIDPAAVECALRNVGLAGGLVHEGDLYQALPPRLKGRVRLLAVNAPYVPTEAISMMPHEAREHESRIALDGGSDGLAFHRRVAAGAPAWLASRGHLLIETSERQAARTAAIMAAAGFDVRTVRSEELDGTAVVGQAPGAQKSAD